MARSTFSDKDKGLEDLVSKLAKAKGLVLTVGVHAEDAGAQYSSGLTVADIATIHEYGNGRIPQRSFIRAWFDENQSKNNTAAKKVAENVIRLKYTAIQGLERLGLYFVGAIQARMAAGIPPPLAQSTIDRKGSSTPLIDTGQLRSSIRSKVKIQPF